MKFEEAVVNIHNSGLRYHPGLQALGNDAKYVKVSDSRKLDGSVDIDGSLEGSYPDASRWDYSFGYRGAAYFVEVHPAYSSEVGTVLKKLEWLKGWLSDEGKPLYAIKAEQQAYVWVYTGKFDIPKNNRQYRAAAQNGIIPIRELRLM